MSRALVLASVILAVSLPLAAPAVSAKAKAHKCEQDEGKKRRNSALGGLLGGIASVAGVRPSVGGFTLPTGQILSEAISALLDCKEQQQAAQATNEALRGGVGTTTSWQSESRSNVSGSSRVTGQQQLADGTRCMTVTDVVIVDGEETTVPKKMCREPGATGWKRA
jgi:surface antigen